MEKSSGKTLIGLSAPSERNLVPWLKAHPSYQVLVTTKKAGVRSRNAGQTSHKAKAEGKREPDSPSKLKMPSLMNPESVRANAKKALAQILMRRCSSNLSSPWPTLFSCSFFPSVCVCVCVCVWCTSSLYLWIACFLHPSVPLCSLHFLLLTS